MKKEFKVLFSWDDEACVLIATSVDIEGLILENESLDLLMERVHHAIPDLLTFDDASYDEASLVFGMSRKDRLVTVG